MSYLGLDIGTSGCKVVAFDGDGRQIASAYREYGLHSLHEGWAELDSAQVMQSCMDVIRQVAAECQSDPVQGIGISSQGEAFTALGPGGEILANAMVSSDTRAAGIADTWTRSFGAERLYEITGHTASPIFTIFKLLWLRDNKPDVWRQASAFYCFEELIQYKLGLNPAISWCLAGRTVLFDIRSHQWNQTILDAIGLERERLARTIPSGEVAGAIPHEIAQGLGLNDGVVVVAGGHDQCCGALGAGVVSAGRAVYGTGTVDCITPAFPKPIFSDDLFRHNLATYDYTVPGMYTTIAYSLTGGNIFRWFRDQFGQLESAEAFKSGVSAYELLLSKTADTPSDLLVLPYWTASGTPYFDSQTSGTITGLRMTTSREDILRGLLEGVALEMRLNLDILSRSGIEIDQLIAIGGGANSRKLIQIKADVLNKSIARAMVTEAGCMGAAMLARRAKTGESVVDIAGDWVDILDVIEPNPRNAAVYDETFQSYLDLYKTLRSFTDRRNKK